MSRRLTAWRSTFRVPAFNVTDVEAERSSESTSRFARPQFWGRALVAACGLGFAVAWLTREDDTWSTSYTVCGAALLVVDIVFLSLRWRELRWMERFEWMWPSAFLLLIVISQELDSGACELAAAVVALVGLLVMCADTFRRLSEARPEY